MLSDLFGVEGRIGRATWWFSFFLCLLISVGYVLFLGFEGALKHYWEMNPSELAVSVGFTIFAWTITICPSIKRFHDINKSGWWVLSMIIPLAGGLWMIWQLGLRHGSVGDNLYGPPPGSGRRGSGVSDDGETKPSAKFAKFDDAYMENYARELALKQATEQAADAPTLATGFGISSSRPAFGKR